MNAEAGVKVAIVVLTYNSRERIERCIDSLRNQDYRDCKLILVDNRSQDDTLNFVKQNYPEVICIDSGYNAGFAEGYNIGMRFAFTLNPTYIMIIQDDTESTKSMLSALVSAMESNQKNGIVSPKIMDMKKRDELQQFGVRSDRFGFPSSNTDETPDEFFYVSGCAMLFKASMLRTIELFDSQYFMFAEDLDICWRARLAGYEISVCPNSIIYHLGGGSISGGYLEGRKYALQEKRLYLRERNTLRTIMKNYSLHQLFKVMPIYISLLSAEFLVMLFKKRAISTVYPSVLWWNLKSIRSTFEERRRVQKIRMVSDKEVMRFMSKKIGKFQLVKKLGIRNIS